ncbi:lipopolysaccharide transport periplasmic protein LptA [Aestuariibacter sp. A3R04]|uniref:lipopolysaccharide transport periplasmic protein LptA n=1 Tax=Aestuariibacter sp. A3R04 TaxID=2841571 RepID=UPI001C098058|nr:lipopolysaccharide transport periplasmic protein LptA [Aestuariibacter sp. A3R04]MBU3020938.1 lipopolysaccharide transport periplasmic protein LptA [Aestuariibacter sp. A3R04]
MFKQRIPLAINVLGLSVFLATAHVAADTDDFDQPITVDANSQFIDGKKKTSVFKDNVKITQGSLVIEADEVEVIASEGEGKEIFIARGQPAKYSQTLDDGAQVKASAETIRYEVFRQLISLNGSAKIQQDTSMVQGESITYDMAKEQLQATGGENSANGRVTTVFRPDAIKAKDKNDTDNDGENK